MAQAISDRGYAGADRTWDSKTTSQDRMGVVMLRGGGGRLLVAVAAGAVALSPAALASGCAVHNPTDLAQRRPVIPTDLPTTRADGTAAFSKKAAARMIAQMGYGNAKPREKPPGPLRAFLASCRGVTAPCLNLFFFYRGRYVGAAFAQPQSALDIRGQDGRMVRATIPSPAGGLRGVRYFWTGGEVIGLTNMGSITVVHTPSRPPSL
jgi:hypothetical protein